MLVFVDNGHASESATNEQENDNAESESFCRQITESAISDDGKPARVCHVESMACVSSC